MSLRSRLNLLHAAVLLIGLGSIIMTIVLDAAPRARAEYSSMMLLARGHVERSLSDVLTSADPPARLRHLIGDLAQLRHIRIAWQANGADDAKARTGRGHDPGSSWLSAMLLTPQDAIRVPLQMPGMSPGHIVIAPSAGDEVAEIWETVTTIAQRGLLLVLSLLGLSSLLVHQALRPIKTISEALPALARGEYGDRVAVAGPPELAAICREINRLSEALQEAKQRNEKLARQMVGARDEERRKLSRELHDELGPHLFSARANGGALVDAARAAPVDGNRITELGAAFLDAIGCIQSINRRILTQLSPPGLRELGLGPALRALVDNWSASLDGLRIELEVWQDANGLAEAESLTVYRVVQECLTNAVRHGRADRIRVEVELATGDSEALASGPVVVVTVQDNGVGPSAQSQPGFGMLGMQERVMAFGGRLRLAGQAEGGTKVVAWIPVTQDRQAPSSFGGMGSWRSGNGQANPGE